MVRTKEKREKNLQAVEELSGKASSPKTKKEYPEDYDSLRRDKKRIPPPQLTSAEKAKLRASTKAIMKKNFGPNGGENVIKVIWV